MSIEHNLRRIAVGGYVPPPVNDPYWAYVSLLMRTSGSSTILNDRTIIDESGNTTSFTYGDFTRFSAQNPSTSYYGSYYNLGPAGTPISEFSGGVITGTNSNINFAGDFTVEFWAMVPYGTSTFGYPSPIITPSNFGFFSSGPVGNTWVATGQYSGSSWYFNSGITSNDGVWRHIALVRNGTSVGNLKLYVDGTNIPGDATTLSTAYNSVFNWSEFHIGCGIGSGPGAGDNQFFGYISNMRFSNVARYTSNFTPSRNPFALDGNTKFLSTLAGGLYDLSNNKFPLLQGYQYPATLVQNSSVQKFTGYNTFNGVVVTAAAGNAGLRIPAYSSSYYPPTSIQCTGDFTLECWVNVPSSTSQYNSATILNTRPNATNLNLILCSNLTALSINNTYGCVLDPGGGTQLVLNSGINAKDSTWHHIAVVRYGTTATFYVDGNATASGFFVGTINFNRTTMFGDAGTPNTQFLGYLDDLRLTKGIARYTSNFAPPNYPFPTQ